MQPIGVDAGVDEHLGIALFDGSHFGRRQRGIDELPVGAVFDVEPGGRQLRYVVRDGVGVVAVAIFDVDAEVARQRLQRRGQGDVGIANGASTVAVPGAGRHSEAGGADRREAVGKKGQRRRHIPGVGQHKRNPLVMKIVKTHDRLPAIRSLHPSRRPTRPGRETAVAARPRTGSNSCLAWVSHVPHRTDVFTMRVVLSAEEFECLPGPGGDTSVKDDKHVKPPFEAVVTRHGATVFRVVRAVVGQADAEDAWSETFLSALRAYPDLPADANVEAWLVTIAHRRAIDVGRARSRNPVPTDTLPDRPATHALDLDAAVGALPPKQRQAVAYHYLAGLPYAEIAVILDSSVAAARRAAADGIATLRRTYPLIDTQGITDDHT